MLNPAPANPNLFASHSEAHALVCLVFKNSSLSKRCTAYITRLGFSLADSPAHLDTQNSSHSQALFLFCALKTHTFKIVRGI